MGCDVFRLNLLEIMKMGKNWAKMLKAFFPFNVENWYFATRYLLIFQKTSIMQIFDFGPNFFEKKIEKMKKILNFFFKNFFRKILGQNRKSALLKFFEISTGTLLQNTSFLPKRGKRP